MTPIELAEQHVRDCEAALDAAREDLRFAKKLLAKLIEEETP